MYSGDGERFGDEGGVGSFIGEVVWYVGTCVENITSKYESKSSLKVQSFSGISFSL